jgi:Tfp pilus assembly protein PilF
MTSCLAMRQVAIGLILGLCLAGTAFAEMVEVAPGVRVTKKTFNAPLNEQPFYGFTEFSAQQRAANEEFVKGALDVTGGDRKKAVDEIVTRGWVSFFEGKLDEAARRFNQAFLVDPQQSSVYHSFAAIADERFNDRAYAEELFVIARALPNPMIMLNADYGRFLVKMGRPREARPLLEQAIIDAPNFATAWANLGFVRLAAGDQTGGCAAVNKALELEVSASSRAQYTALALRAQCGKAP